MRMYSGRGVWPKDNPYGKPADVGPSVEDIAVGLGKITRFAGQARFYPVLCHVLAGGEHMDPGMEVYFLLHDAPECVVSDVPTPWKSPAAEAYELDLLERISREHGLPWPWPQEVHEAVKDMDRRMLTAEVSALGYNGDPDWVASLPQPEYALFTTTQEYMHDAVSFIDDRKAIAVFRSRFNRALGRALAVQGAA
jgi:hypothetical protein